MSGQRQRTAAVLSIGDELTTGQNLDTNSRWISGRLTDRGYRITEHATVGDDTGHIAETLARLATTNDAVIATGGLGPTADDLSRDALAQLLGDELVEDERQLARLKAMFADRGRELTDANRLQALRPASAECLDNDNGTAPAIVATHDGTAVLILPGPPRENQPIVDRCLEDLLKAPGPAVSIRVIQHFGIPESSAADRLGAVLDRDRNPLVGITASDGVISCRARFTGPESEAEGELDRTDRAIEEALGEFRIGYGPATLAQHVVETLIEQNTALRVAESCTGGMLGASVTGVSGSSAVFEAGWQVYSNEAKQSQLGVKAETLAAHGAVSEAVARELAHNAATSDIGTTSTARAALSITGIAGPGGATPGKPVGTVFIGLAHAENGVVTRDEVRRMRFPGDRHAARSRSSQAALAMLLFSLRGRPLDALLWQVPLAGEPEA